MKKRRTVFYCGIVLAIFISVLLMMTGCGKEKDITSDLSKTTVKKTTVMAETTADGNSKKKNTVTFYSSDGIILDREYVYEGETPVTPEDNFTKEGYIFTGWGIKPGKEESKGTDNTAKQVMTLPDITSDVDFTPNYLNINDKPNVFAFPAVYGKIGAVVKTNLQLCGKVDLCAFDIQISYNPKALEFAGFGNEDGDVLVNCDKANGIIRANFSNTSNVTGSIQLFNMKFKIISKKTLVSDLKIKAVELVKLGKDKSFLTPGYTFINGKVYIS